jgi:hypothetical protein
LTFSLAASDSRAAAFEKSGAKRSVPFAKDRVLPPLGA